MRLICLGYLLVLTVGLVGEHPLDALDRRSAAAGLLALVAPAAHLIGFAVLAALVFLCRWPATRGILLAMLVAYAVATEAIHGLLPYRQAELVDLAQNLAGIGLGALAGHLGQRLFLRRRIPTLPAQPST